MYRDSIYPSGRGAERLNLEDIDQAIAVGKKKLGYDES